MLTEIRPALSGLLPLSERCREPQETASFLDHGPLDVLPPSLNGEQAAVEAAGQGTERRNALALELKTLYALCRVFERPETFFDEVVRNAIEVVCSMWDHPHDGGMRVVVHDSEYLSSGFCETPWRQSCDIFVRGQRVGSAELFRPDADAPALGNPLREGDVDLLQTLAGHLGGILERRQVEDERAARLQRQLHSTQRMEAIGQLASGMAHDFNNLLTVILHATERMKIELNPDDHAREALAAIDEAAHQAVSVIRSLLTFSREGSVSRRPVLLNELLEESSRLLRRTLPSSIQLIIEHDTAPLWINADPTQIQQILFNLVINARDAMPRGGSLRIVVSPAAPADLENWKEASRAASGYVRLSVSDDGCGIPPELQTRVFEPFFTTKPRDQATGLGLAMVHRMTQRHQGRITLDSQVGKGTTFTVLLPRSRSAGVKAQSTAPAALPRGESGLLLLAASDPHLRGVVTMTLETLGYEVVQVDAPSTARQRFEQYRDRIRALIVDGDLSNQDMLGCVEALRTVEGRPPIIVMTDAVMPPSDWSIGDQARILRKPFRAAELGRLVRDVLAPAKLTEVCS